MITGMLAFLVVYPETSFPISHFVLPSQVIKVSIYLLLRKANIFLFPKLCFQDFEAKNSSVDLFEMQISKYKSIFNSLKNFQAFGRYQVWGQFHKPNGKKTQLTGDLQKRQHSVLPTLVLKYHFLIVVSIAL